MTAPHLLLVEDSETQALQFRLLFEAEGFRVDRTATAEDALARLNGTLPDALVVDYRLPGMNGDELVRLVRQSSRTRTLPVLLLTETAAADVERQGLDSGANAYVPKAAEPALLFSRLRALLRQRPGDAAPVAEDAAFRLPRLLLVEESPTCRLLLQALLTGDGYRVDAVEPGNGLDARIAEGGFDVVLLGLGGPAALALCRDLDARRSREGGSFEIVGLGDADQIVAGFAAGADEVLPRSEDREMLLVRLRAVLRRKLARDEEARAAAHEREREAALARARAEAEAADALAAANRELADANARLHETQGQLVQAAKMASLGELVAGIAHEINNPLAFILAHHSTVARLLGDAQADASAVSAPKLARAAGRLGSMRDGLVRIQELVVKLRRFTRLDEGEPVHLDIAEAIEGVIALLRPKLGDAIAIERRYEGPATLLCSPALVNQVVMNILANAADVLGEGGGRIVIATGSDHGHYRIRIGDSGPGIPAELHARVFEPFFTTKDVGSGTGLGLAIAYGVVRAHGGRLDIGESEDGGALFTITVPIRSS